MKYTKLKIIAASFLAIASLSAQSELFTFGFDAGSSRSATLAQSGFSVGNIFTNLPVSQTLTNPLVDGAIDDGTILITESLLFVERGPGLSFSSSTPISSFTITADANTQVDISGFSLQGIEVRGAFRTDNTIFVGIGENGTVASTTSGTDLAPFTTSTNGRTLTDGITIAAGETKTIDIFINSGSTTSRNILNTFRFLGTTTTVVPEPSTYAAIFGGLVLVFAMVRRRMK